MAATQYVFDRNDCRRLDAFPGVRMFAKSGDHLTLSLVELEPGAVIPLHSHPHEQMGLLLEGELSLTIGGQTHVVKPGQMWRIPGGVEHAAVASDRLVKAVDAFHPVREDYR